MPAPGQPIGVVTVTPSGRSGLAPAEKSLLEWAGGNRVTLAIVFTDIVGSTALNVELGDAAMSEVRRQHFAQSTALLAKHAGHEVKTIGDSVMAVFRSVEAALGYTRALQADPGSSELQVRAGIHIGPVEVTVDDVFGAEVALASRVVAAIAGAEIQHDTQPRACTRARDNYRHRNRSRLESTGRFRPTGVLSDRTSMVQSRKTKPGRQQRIALLLPQTTLTSPQ
jgi:class 3 adenylate cyclase